MTAARRPMTDDRKSLLVPYGHRSTVIGLRIRAVSRIATPGADELAEDVLHLGPADVTVIHFGLDRHLKHPIILEVTDHINP